jgi:transcriptional regulator with XRE-family HTH domain
MEPVDYVSVGERIAIYRRRRGLSQVALANLIGRSEAWVSQVERGIRHVDHCRSSSGLLRSSESRWRI